MKNQQLTFRKSLMIASLIFGMLFGAGNLIFPVHLGQLAGAHWLAASGGFLISGVLLPLMALLAISITRSDSVYELARPIGHWYALIFLVLVHATLGPLLATPRTATVPYAIGIAPHLSAGMNQVGLLIYTAIFFIIVYCLSVKEAKITDLIGKILNPVFLILLFLIFLMAFWRPIGNPQTSTVTAAYVHSPLANGFLEGYNTMDALGALTFGVTVITAIKEMGIKDAKAISTATAKSGFFGICGIAILYIGLIWLGAISIHHFAISDNGGTALNQIAHYYMGTVGDAILATLATVTCMSTAMGLVVAFAQDFHDSFPRISYRAFLAFNCALSLIVANLGLDNLITWSTPVLMLLYPLAITMIILGMLSPLFDNDSIVYRVTTILTLIPAFFDMVNSLPPLLKNSGIAQNLIAFARHWLPLFDLGFSWLPFAILGVVIGLIWHLIRRKH